MNLSRKWLNEFVTVEANDKEFAEAMTLSGSKVEITTDLGAEISNVVVGRIVSMVRHPNSDHMWICQLDVGQEEPVQIVTGAWNIHVGDLVPAALHKATLPGGVKIEKGKLRGEKSNGMLCSLKELNLEERDFPYAAVIPAALLNDYKPLNPEKPSIPADIQPGDKVFGPVVCARVLECAAQPDGSYRTCLDLGGATACPDTVCSNLHEGDLVAYHTKSGSICTLADLHAEQAEFPHCIPDGIFVLREEGVKPGDDIKGVIGADDHVVEFEITPNRPDCLSVIGLAREAAATFDQPLKLHEPVVKGGGPGSLVDLLDVETPAADLVPRYTARMVRNVKIAPSPKWMRERLRAMGVRPINNIVDITNYVMLEYGQPMHAFDYRYVKGGKIIVRRAEEGEELTTLDGNVRKLTASHLVIADETRAVGLAGIMGGENSEIVSDTTDVVFESACFDGTCIRKGALSLGMRTEASAKFEKGLDPLNTMPAVERACELVELLGAGEVVDGVIDILNYVPQPRVLPLEPAKINALLGTDIPEAEMVAILKKLDFQVENGAVTVPPGGATWRAWPTWPRRSPGSTATTTSPPPSCGARPPWAATPPSRDWRTAWASCAAPAGTTRSSPTPSSPPPATTRSAGPRTTSPARASRSSTPWARTPPSCAPPPCPPCWRSSPGTTTTATSPPSSMSWPGSTCPAGRTALPTRPRCSPWAPTARRWTSSP